MVNGIGVTEVRNVAGNPTVDGRELSEQEIRENYLQLGNMLIQRDLYDSYAT